MLADKSKAMTIAQWQSQGMKRADGKPFPDAPRRPTCWRRPARRGPAS